VAAARDSRRWKMTRSLSLLDASSWPLVTRSRSVHARRAYVHGTLPPAISAHSKINFIKPTCVQAGQQHGDFAAYPGSSAIRSLPPSGLEAPLNPPQPIHGHCRHRRRAHPKPDRHTSPSCGSIHLRLGDEVDRGRGRASVPRAWGGGGGGRGGTPNVPAPPPATRGAALVTPALARTRSLFSFNAASAVAGTLEALPGDSPVEWRRTGQWCQLPARHPAPSVRPRARYLHRRPAACS
jgi:hypothetical protein